MQTFLSLSDEPRESISVSLMDMDGWDDLILGLDWISSHGLRHLSADGRVNIRSGPALLQLVLLDLLPASARLVTRALQVIAHGESLSSQPEAPPPHRAAGAGGAGRTTRAERPRRTPSTAAASPLDGVVAAGRR